MLHHRRSSRSCSLKRLQSNYKDKSYLTGPKPRPALKQVLLHNELAYQPNVPQSIPPRGQKATATGEEEASDSEVLDILSQASKGEAVAAALMMLSMLVKQQKTLAEQIAALHVGLYAVTVLTAQRHPYDGCRTRTVEARNIC